MDQLRVYILYCHSCTAQGAPGTFTIFHINYMYYVLYAVGPV